ncbi:MAG TPA: T9SS type A sorting domain-containing protein, partial [Saprospiraceae bacterium]|nr:T9SS type A sorting domain-containing protein [Saprospiraceae bacterium]
VIRLNIGPLTSVQEPALAAGAVSVFPNPANEEVKVAFKLDAPSAEVEVSIMDLSGKVLRTERHQNLFRDQLTINTAQLPAGAYNVRIRTEQGVAVQRVVVQH